MFLREFLQSPPSNLYAAAWWKRRNGLSTGNLAEAVFLLSKDSSTLHIQLLINRTLFSVDNSDIPISIAGGLVASDEG